MSNRRPSLQVDGVDHEGELVFSNQSSDTKLLRKRTMPARMSLTPDSLLLPNSKIISRSTKSLHSSMDIRETLDAKTVDEDDGGRRLNQYTIGPVLGKGSFGIVYRAYDREENRFVALKEFSKTKLRKQRAQKEGAFLFGRGRGRGRGLYLMN